MSVRSVVTMGYGDFGSPALVTLLGYGLEGDAPIPHTSGGRGGRKKRHQMSSSNRAVSLKGKDMSVKGKPKDTSGGADLSGNAKNKISGPAGLLTKEQSPSSWAQSRNKNKKSGGMSANMPHKSKRY